MHAAKIFVLRYTEFPKTMVFLSAKYREGLHFIHICEVEESADECCKLEITLLFSYLRMPLA